MPPSPAASRNPSAPEGQGGVAGGGGGVGAGRGGTGGPPDGVSAPRCTGPAGTPIAAATGLGSDCPATIAGLDAVSEKSDTVGSVNSAVSGVLSAAMLAASCPVDCCSAATVGRLVLETSDSCNDA